MTAAIPIQVRQLLSLEEIRRLFEAHLDSKKLRDYRLPATDAHTRVIVGLSGGADSTVLALFAAAYLAEHYPYMEFVFTDTKAEPESCYATLDEIERVTGFSVTRLQPEQGLFERIDQYKGFLPSGQARWCTRELKVNPLMDYLNQLPEGTKRVNLAGIRYDEANRDGLSFTYSMEQDNAAAFPFIDLGITKTMVFDILDRSVGIPETYKYRSRSGCFSCFFQRNAEAIGMLINDPQHFAMTERYEKLSEADQKRWGQFPTTLTEAGLGALYPIPAFVDARKPTKVPEKPPEKIKAPKGGDGQQDLLGFSDAEQVPDNVFVAVAVYVDERLAGFGDDPLTPGTYWQELITVSPSLSGLKSALGNHYKFRSTTPMAHYDIEDMRIIIAQIAFEPGVIDMGKPEQGSYTWKSETAYRQIRHVVRHCQSVLNYTDLQRQLADHQATLARDDVPLGTLMSADERAEMIESQLAKTDVPAGELVWEGLYTPSRDVKKQVQMQLEGVAPAVDSGKKAREGFEHDEVPQACLACSI